jgi:hypothetical protein
MMTTASGGARQTVRRRNPGSAIPESPRFNFEMTGRGCVLANFNFKRETNELFPTDF